MNREIKFRGKSKIDGSWVFGLLSYAHQENQYYIGVTELLIPVIPETVGQFTGLNDKYGQDIYEGDYVFFKIPYRTTQTHTGDNIPNGSYTEPMEPGIKFMEGEVKYENGIFFIDHDENNDPGFRVPMAWNHLEFWDIEMIKDSISWTRQDAGWFDDPEEGDLQYLIKEVVKVKDEKELIEYLNGFEITGNIHENDN